MKSEFLRELKSRGIFKDCTNLMELDNLLSSREKKCAYIGFDLTAPSLHVGSLVQIMVLRLMKKYDIQPIVLLGSATTKIGDPSDKDEIRKMLEEKTIIENKASIKSCISQFIQDVVFVDNNEWLGDIKYMEFLREYGPMFSVNTMLKLDSVKRRLDRNQHLSFLEFNYMLLQSYDFVELYRRYSCRIQFGGSEQWSNIINGVELARRLDFKELYGLTTNLIVTNDGKKMGKTVKGAIWLKKEMLPVYNYWQFWRNTKDEEVFKFLKLFTDLSLEEIVKLERENINDIKILLANKATEICHGKKRLFMFLKRQRRFLIIKLMRWT